MSRILYHGTCHRFSLFSEGYIGVGGDANSALGVFFCESPSPACDYAELAASQDRGAIGPLVLVVEADIRNPYVTCDLSWFFGDESENKELARASFVEKRRSLLAEGYDAIEVETGEEPIIVVLDVNKLHIVTFLSSKEAYEMEDIDDFVECLRVKKSFRKDTSGSAPCP